jgi:hypothetical protein
LFYTLCFGVVCKVSTKLKVIQIFSMVCSRSSWFCILHVNLWFLLS